MDQDQSDRDNLAAATEYISNALQRDGIDVQSLGFSYTGYDEDWSVSLWLNPGPLGLTVSIRLFRAGNNRGHLHVPDYSNTFCIEDLDIVGPQL